MQKLMRHLFKEKVDGKTFVIGGLLPHEEDERDFRYSDLGGWFDYKPKHSVHLIDVGPVFDQTPNNTCVWHSLATSRYPSEGVALSPRSVVAFAKKNGLLRSDGLSSLREGGDAAQQFGLASLALVPNDNLRWVDYSSLDLTVTIKEDAAKHRTKSYFLVRGKNEVLKALDEGHAIRTGFDWYSGYNMTSGFRGPDWILPWRKGFKVGGHAVTICGYDIPRGLLRLRNSFSGGWGLEGDFYVRMSDFFRNDIPCYVDVDLDDDKLAKFLKSHEGRDVKSDDGATIYRIQDGKKRPYLNEITFYAFGGIFDNDYTPDGLKSGPTFERVAGSLLELMPEGAPMDAPESPNWPKLANAWAQISWMRYPDNVKTIKSIIYPE